MLRRLLIAGLATVLLASCSGGDDETSPTTTSFNFDSTSTTLLPTTPVVAKVLSPEPASVQGAGGRGMVVALKFSATDPTVLPAEFRLGGALPAPAPAAKPGHNPAFPGLVVALSSTGTALGGPSVNLANLFQVVSPSLQPDGSREVSAVWTNSTVDFGTDVDTTLTAYVVAGTAPDTIPPGASTIPDPTTVPSVTTTVPSVTTTVPSVTTTIPSGPTTTLPGLALDVLSNTVEVTFHIGGAVDSSATPAVGTPSSTTTTRPRATATTRAGATTTTRAGATTTTAQPATTTTRATTTVPASSSTTRCTIAILGTPC